MADWGKEQRLRALVLEVLVVLACLSRVSGFGTPPYQEGTELHGANRKLLGVTSHGYRRKGELVQELFQIVRSNIPPTRNQERILLGVEDLEYAAASSHPPHVPSAPQSMDVEALGADYNDPHSNPPKMDHDEPPPLDRMRNPEVELFAVDYHTPGASDPIIDHGEPPAHGRDDVKITELDYHEPAESDPFKDHGRHPPPSLTTEKLGMDYSGTREINIPQAHVKGESFRTDYEGPRGSAPSPDHNSPPPPY